jgi:para-nitrobenzyl esterase
VAAAIALGTVAVAATAAGAGAGAAHSGAGGMPVVAIDGGAVRGKATGTVAAFVGIPYAAAPVGVLRWRAPRPGRPLEWGARRDGVCAALRAAGLAV